MKKDGQDQSQLSTIVGQLTDQKKKKRKRILNIFTECVFTRVELFQGAFTSQQPPSEEMKQVGR